MSNTFTILVRIFIKPFYRQHAGFFIFIFLILFGAVGMVDGAGLLDYHYSLIRGMLKNPFLFLLVLFFWLLYAKKCEQFMLNTIRRPEISFLQMLALLDFKKLYLMLISVQVFLLLPLIAYAILIGITGIYLHAYWSIAILLAFLSIICLSSARWYLHQFQKPVMATEKMGKLAVRLVETAYWVLLIRFIWSNKKLLFVGMKIFSCGILLGMLANQTGTDYELNMIILFFSIGLLGHGLLIHQIRELEETRLTFYRTVPVSLLKRFYQYAIFYFFLVLPEICSIAVVAPEHLSYSNALLFAFFSYSVLLFLHSLLFIQFFPMKDYLKITVCLFLIIYGSVLTATFIWLCLFLFLSSLFIFRGCYYQYERQVVS